MQYPIQTVYRRHFKTNRDIYVELILNDDKPDAKILYIGCNDIGNKKLTENEIEEWIVKIGRHFKESNSYDVFISSLIGRAQK